MKEGSERSPVVWVAGALVALGIGLGIFVDMGWLVLSGLGAFGPGALRELGWLRDQDEYQRLAAQRAGYLAYLVGGGTAVLTIAIRNAGAANLEGSTWVALVLVVLWLTWMFAALLQYWGAQTTATRVLLVFGSFWAVFVVAGHLTEPVELLLESLIVIPFFVLAWMSGRWPRASGGALLVLSFAAFGYLFDFGWQFIEWPSQVLTFVMLVVPLLSCGVALLRVRHDDAVPA